MSRRFVQQLSDGDAIDEVYLVGEKQLRANRNGNFYIQVELRDRTGGITGRMWNAGEQIFRTFDEGDFLQVKGKVQLFQGNLQMIVNQLDRITTDNVALTDFLPHTEHDVGKLLDRLRGILRSLSNPYLRALSECFLMDEAFVRDFCQVPAGVRNHHAYIGGLLEHVVTLLDAADRIVPVYPDLDRDLLLSGVFLHDIGKVRELSYKRVFSYTDEGQLCGHIMIGVEMLNEKAAQVAQLMGEPFPTELLLRLKHMILAHHGTYEFGSPRLPMTPEAIALHHLDNLDAKVHEFARSIQEDPNSGSNWTPYSPRLDRKLFKGESSGGA